MTVKLIGCLMLVCACFFTGCLFSARLIKRRNFLNGILNFINALAANIRYNSSDIFTNVSDSSNDSISFLGSSDFIPFEEQWFSYIDRLPESSGISKSDRMLLKEFGADLGKSDIDGELERIELYKTVFSKQLAEAENDISKKSALYKALGLFAGIVLSLMIL